jgi:hypothetical protein
MRSTILVTCAVFLAIAVGAPRDAQCCRLGGRTGASASLIVTVAASRGDARPLTFRELSKLETPAPFDPRPPVHFFPTWETIAGHTRAGFAISGRF